MKQLARVHPGEAATLSDLSVAPVYASNVSGVANGTDGNGCFESNVGIVSVQPVY